MSISQASEGKEERLTQERQALPHQVMDRGSRETPDGLESRSLGLTLRVGQEVWRKQELRLRCSSSVIVTYTFEAVRLLSSGQLLPASSVQRTPEAPVISGGSSSRRLRAGDWLSLNCSSKADDVHLKWIVDERDVSPLLPILSLVTDTHLSVSLPERLVHRRTSTSA